MTDINKSRAQIFKNIDTELSSISFNGLPIGSTVSDPLVIYYLNNHPVRNLWKTRLVNIREWLKSFRLAKCPFKQDLTRDRNIWLTCYNHERIEKMMLPIVAVLPEEKLVLITPRPIKNYKDNVLQITASRVMDCPGFRWSIDYPRLAIALRKDVDAIFSKYVLPEDLQKYIKLSLMRNAMSISTWRAAIQRCQPAVVITEYDRNALWSPLVLAARLEGVPTITLVHGAMPSDCLGFTPVLADWILCWGLGQKKALMDSGESEQKILALGCPAISRENIAPIDTKKRLGLRLDKPAVLLASSNIENKERFRLAEDFCISATDSSNWLGLVRLHPSEKLEDYRHLQGKYPEVRFQTAVTASLEENIAMADIIVMRDSSVGAEALIKQKLVVVFSPEGVPSRGLGKELVDYGAAPLATNPVELRDLINAFLFDATYKAKFREKAESYVKQLCSYFSADSAKMIGSFVLSARKHVLH